MDASLYVKRKQLSLFLFDSLTVGVFLGRIQALRRSSNTRYRTGDCFTDAEGKH